MAPPAGRRGAYVYAFSARARGLYRARPDAGGRAARHVLGRPHGPGASRIAERDAQGGRACGHTLGGPVYPPRRRVRPRAAEASAFSLMQARRPVLAFQSQHAPGIGAMLQANPRPELELVKAVVAGDAVAAQRFL